MSDRWSLKGRPWPGRTVWIAMAAQETWGSIAVRQAYLMLSSIVGQADLLIADGLVQEAVRDDGVAVFNALDGALLTADV